MLGRKSKKRLRSGLFLFIILWKPGAGFVKQCVCGESNAKAGGVKHFQSSQLTSCRLTTDTFVAKEGPKTFLFYLY